MRSFDGDTDADGGDGSDGVRTVGGRWLLWQAVQLYGAERLYTGCVDDVDALYSGLKELGQQLFGLE